MKRLSMQLSLILLVLTFSVYCMEYEQKLPKRMACLKKLCANVIASYVTKNCAHPESVKNYLTRTSPLEVIEEIKNAIENNNQQVWWPYGVSSLLVKKNSKIQGHVADQDVPNVQLSQDCSLIVTGNFAGDLCILSAETGGLYDTFYNYIQEYPSIQDIIISKDDRYIITYSEEGIACIYGAENGKWDTQQGKLLYTLDSKNNVDFAHYVGHTTKINSIALSDDATLLITGLSDGSLGLWDNHTQKLLKILKSPEVNFISSIAISTDNRFVAGGFNNNLVHVWDCSKLDFLDKVSEEKPFLTIKAFEDLPEDFSNPSYISALALSSCKQYIVASSTSGHTGIFNLITGKLEQLIPSYAESERITTIIISSNSSLIALLGSRKILRLWDTYSGNEVLKIHDVRASSLVLNWEQKYLALANVTPSKSCIYSVNQVTTGYSLQDFIEKIKEHAQESKKIVKCTICAERLDGTEYKLRCGHSQFHRACIEEWQVSYNDMDFERCPLCD